MDNEVLKLIATQGAFAVLFTYLLFYVLNESSKRENKYQSTTQELTGLLPEIKQDVEDIKEKFLSEREV